MQCIYTIEYYSTLKRNLPLARAWKNPEDSMVNENKVSTKRQLYLEAKKQIESSYQEIAGKDTVILWKSY